MPEQTFPQARLIHRLNRTVLPVTQAGIGVWARQRPAIGATAAESQAAHWPTPRQKCVLSFKTHSSSPGSRFARSHLPNIFHAKARAYSTKGHACPSGLVTRFQRCGENGRSGRIAPSQCFQGIRLATGILRGAESCGFPDALANLLEGVFRDRSREGKSGCGEPVSDPYKLPLPHPRLPSLALRRIGTKFVPKHTGDIFRVHASDIEIATLIVGVYHSFFTRRG